MNISELIENLKAQLQELEDAKQRIAEAQEDLRATISEIQMGSIGPQEETECEGCHREFPSDSVIETEFGFLCRDCFSDRMAIEDKEIYE